MPQHDTTELTPGDRVKFTDERRRCTVRAAGARFAICTKPFAAKGPGVVLYTIVDWERGIRGRENLIFCMGFETDEKCQAALARLVSGESEVSHRHHIALEIESVTHA